MSGTRQLVVVLGDQLDPGSAAFDGFEAQRGRSLGTRVVERAVPFGETQIHRAA